MTEDRLTEMRVDRIRYAERPTHGSAVAEYHVTDALPEQTVRLLDHDQGTVRDVAGTAGLAVHREQDGTRRLIILDATWQSGAQELYATVGIDWDDEALTRAGVLPLRMLPAHLPEPLTEHSPYPSAFSRWPDPDPRIPAVRLDLDADTLVHAGHVRDADGQSLMAAIPVRPGLTETCWYANDRIVLAGEGWGTVSADHRDALRDRILDVHAFLDAEFGGGKRVRAFVLCEANALHLPRGWGQFVALSDTHLDGDRRWFIAERHFAEQIASIWWTYGVRFRGGDGFHMAEGLALYAVLRWFEATGKTEHLSRGLTFYHKVISRIEAKEQPPSGRSMWLALRIALALHAQGGAALRAELRAWCGRDWGWSLHVDEARRRLARLGITLPTNDNGVA